MPPGRGSRRDLRPRTLVARALEEHPGSLHLHRLRLGARVGGGVLRLPVPLRPRRGRGRGGRGHPPALHRGGNGQLPRIAGGGLERHRLPARYGGPCGRGRAGDARHASRALAALHARRPVGGLGILPRARAVARTPLVPPPPRVPRRRPARRPRPRGSGGREQDREEEERAEAREAARPGGEPRVPVPRGARGPACGHGEPRSPPRRPPAGSRG